MELIILLLHLRRNSCTEESRTELRQYADFRGRGRPRGRRARFARDGNIYCHTVPAKRRTKPCLI